MLNYIEHFFTRADCSLEMIIFMNLSLFTVIVTFEKVPY